MRERTQTLRVTCGLVALVVCGTAVAVPHAVAADDEAQAEAKLRFKRGSRLYDEGNFRDAAREFEAGYALYPRPGFLVNIGHSYRRSGDLRKAKRYYEMFLQAADGEPAQREEVSQQLKKIDEVLAEQGVDAADDGPAVPLPAAPVRTVPTRTTLVAAPTQAPSPVTERSAATTWWFWTLLGGTLVAGVAAGFLVGRGHDGGSSQDRLCGTLGCLHE